jgi:hypothetical protein
MIACLRGAVPLHGRSKERPHASRFEQKSLHRFRPQFEWRPTDEVEEEDGFDDEDLDETPTKQERNEALENQTLGLTDDQREDLWAAFSGSRFTFQFWNAIVGILFCLGAYATLMAINVRLAGPSSATRIQLYPQPAMWWFFPGFGAFCLAWDIRVLLWLLFGDSRKARLYRIWANRRAAGEQNVYATSPFNRWCIRLIVLPLALGTVLALNMHATVGPESIRDCGYAFKPCEVYPLSGARRITAIRGYRTKEGKFDPQAGLVIDFKDGRRWSSANWGDFKDAIDPNLTNFLLQKTSLALNTAVAEDDIPPLE